MRDLVVAKMYVFDFSFPLSFFHSFLRALFQMLRFLL